MSPIDVRNERIVVEIGLYRVEGDIRLSERGYRNALSTVGQIVFT